MERKKRINWNGREVDAVEIGFRSEGEHWNQYLADDGTVIRLKLVVTEVNRIEGEFDQMGNPVYAVASTNVVAVSAPEDKRRGGG